MYCIYIWVKPNCNSNDFLVRSWIRNRSLILICNTATQKEMFNLRWRCRGSLVSHGTAEAAVHVRDHCVVNTVVYNPNVEPNLHYYKRFNLLKTKITTHSYYYYRLPYISSYKHSVHC